MISNPIFFFILQEEKSWEQQHDISTGKNCRCKEDKFSNIVDNN